jgi:putative peptide zinc metalloprotease protein
MSTAVAQQYYVIPLSAQRDGELYVVGNPELGEYYQFPEEGITILEMLKSGASASEIRSQLASRDEEPVDVDQFIETLVSVGLIHPQEQRQAVEQQLQMKAQDSRRVFDVNPRIARAILSKPALLLYAGVIVYAVVCAIGNPQLRLKLDAFYIDDHRTALLLCVMALAFIQVAMHETGHMLAAARYGIKSRYGLGNRLWMLVAESDLTGILSLPRSQRYFPMFAGALADIFCMALLTILIKFLLEARAAAFTVQVFQALVLEITIGIAWQFNIFVKTDLYFIICNYFSHPDLDRDARAYLQQLLYRATFGCYGRKAVTEFRNVVVLRLFATIWLVGRILSLLVLFGVFLPTMAQYIRSIASMSIHPPASAWMMLDTIVYVAVTLTLITVGMSMWLRQR